jgi:hypothetical protein
MINGIFIGKLSFLKIYQSKAHRERLENYANRILKLGPDGPLEVAMVYAKLGFCVDLEQGQELHDSTLPYNDFMEEPLVSPNANKDIPKGTPLEFTFINTSLICNNPKGVLSEKETEIHDWFQIHGKSVRSGVTGRLVVRGVNEVLSARKPVLSPPDEGEPGAERHWRSGRKRWETFSLRTSTISGKYDYRRPVSAFHWNPPTMIRRFLDLVVEGDSS